MKRTVLFLVIGWSITIQVAALDFGCNLSNATGLNGTDKTFNISHANESESCS